MPPSSFGFAATLLACSASLCSEALAQGEVFIDRGRLDTIAPPPLKPEPRTPDETKLPAAPTREAPDQKFRTLSLLGETDPVALKAIETRLAPLRDQPITRALLAQALDAISEYYRGIDVMLYRAVIPEQTFADGRVQIVVLQGYISEVIVEAPDKRMTAALRKRALKLTAERPLKRSSLERTLLLMNDFPGLAIVPSIEPVAGERNAVRLKIVAQQRRHELGASVQNGGQELLGGTQFDTSVAFNSTLVAGDRIQAYYGFPAEFDRYQFFALVYGAPIGVDGMRVQVSGSSLRTDPGDLKISGRARTASVQVSYPLLRNRIDSLTASGSFDALGSDNAFLGQVIADERTRVLRGALNYAHTRDTRSFGAAGTVSAGIAGIGARVNSALGGPEFLKGNARLFYSQQILARTTLALVATGQIAGDRLPNSERFQFGGPVNGRGFPSGYASSTRGATASAELARTLPKMGSLVEPQAFAFADAGHLARDNVYGAPDRDLASAGFGVGAVFAHVLLARVQFAKPVAGGDGDSHILFTLKAAL